MEIEREKILAALRGYFAAASVDANWEAIRGLSDDGLVITLAMACPFEAVEKQALLEAPTDSDRAATLLALLQMGAAGPDARLAARSVRRLDVRNVDMSVGPPARSRRSIPGCWRCWSAR